MATKRRIEIYSAGCPVCEDVIARVRDIACPSCDITVLDMNDTDVAARAKTLGIASLPAVVIAGALAACCAGGGPDAAVLRAAGLGQPLP